MIILEDATPQDDIFRTKPAKTSTSDDEQQWLDALEAGTLDDSGAVKKDKDPSLLTTRQVRIRSFIYIFTKCNVHVISRLNTIKLFYCHR